MNIKRQKFGFGKEISYKEGYNYIVVTKGDRIKKVILLVEPKSKYEKYTKMVYTRENSQFNKAVKDAFKFLLKNNISEYMRLARVIKDSNSIFSKYVIKLYLDYRGLGSKIKTYTIDYKDSGAFLELYVNKEGVVSAVLLKSKDNIKTLLYRGNNGFEEQLKFFLEQYYLKEDFGKFNGLFYDIAVTDTDCYNLMYNIRYGPH